MKTYIQGKARVQKDLRPHWNGARWSEPKKEEFNYGDGIIRGWAELQGRYDHPQGTVLVHAQCRYKMETADRWGVLEGHVSFSLHRGNGSGEEVYRFDQFTGVRPSVRKIVHQARLFLEENSK